MRTIWDKLHDLVSTEEGFSLVAVPAMIGIGVLCFAEINLSIKLLVLVVSLIPLTFFIVRPLLVKFRQKLVYDGEASIDINGWPSGPPSQPYPVTLVVPGLGTMQFAIPNSLADHLQTSVLNGPRPHEIDEPLHWQGTVRARVKRALTYGPFVEHIQLPSGTIVRYDEIAW